MHVRALVVMGVLVTGPGITAEGVRVAHTSRMAGKPYCSTSTTAPSTHLRPSCWV